MLLILAPQSPFPASPPTSVDSVPSAISSLSCLRSGGPSGRHFSFNFPLLTPFLATLAGHSQLSENATTLSLVFVTLTDVVKRKSFACHSYRKHRGVAVRPLPVSPHPPLVYPACPEKRRAGSRRTTISFRITFFAHPYHLTLIESHSCKKHRGAGPV